VLRVDGLPERLTPPASLAPDAKQAFIDIVNASEPKHFKPSDTKAICRLASAHVWAERAEAQLEADGGITPDGKASPWHAVLEKHNRTVATLMTKLRLTPQSRVDARAAGRNADVPTRPPPWATG
jgi:hypothetical protein